MKIFWQEGTLLRQTETAYSPVHQKLILVLHNDKHLPLVPFSLQPFSVHPNFKAFLRLT